MKSHCFENNLQNEKVSYCNKYFMLSYLNILARVFLEYLKEHFSLGKLHNGTLGGQS